MKPLLRFDDDSCKLYSTISRDEEKEKKKNSLDKISLLLTTIKNMRGVSRPAASGRTQHTLSVPPFPRFATNSSMEAIPNDASTN